MESWGLQWVLPSPNSSGCMTGVQHSGSLSDQRTGEIGHQGGGRGGKGRRIGVQRKSSSGRS